MNLIKCQNNHLYNADHFPTCPYCSSEASSLSPDQLLGSNESNINTSPIERSIEEMNKKELIAGWLVCIDGSEYGQYYPIFSGSNAIGRGSNMDICLSNDFEISRLVHAEIYYDIKSNTYTIDVKNGVNPIYVNNTVVPAGTDKPYILHDRDRITMGAHTFIIVELCNDDFSWR